MPSPTRTRDERGLSESIQWAVLLPLVLLAVLGAVHAGVVLHGRTVAANAALAGAETDALSGAAGGAGDRVAREVAEGGGLLDVTTTTSRTASVVRIEVRGRVDSFLPGGATTVTSTAEQPVEVPR